MKIGDNYNFINEKEALVFTGRVKRGKSYWNQFAKVKYPELVHCEILDLDLYKMEKSI